MHELYTLLAYRIGRFQHATSSFRLNAIIWRLSSFIDKNILFCRFIFWSDWGSNPKIERSSMDGADRKTILGSDTLRWPNAVAVDQLLNRLYWVDSGNGYIASSDFDGKDVRQIITSNTVSSFGLAVFEGSLFWTQTRGKVFRASKFDGTNKREIRGAYFKPYTVHVNHVAAKPKRKE